MRRVLRLPALLRAAPCHVAGRRTGGARLRHGAGCDAPLRPRGHRLPALAAGHGPPVSLRHTERHPGVDPPGTARSLPVPLRALGSALTHRVDVALLPPHPRLGRPAAPPERTRSSTRLAARSVGPGTFRRGLRGVTFYAHGRESPCLTPAVFLLLARSVTRTFSGRAAAVFQGTVAVGLA